MSCTCEKRVSNRNFPAHARGECNTGATVSVQCTLCDLLSQPQDYPLDPTRGIIIHFISITKYSSTLYIGMDEVPIGTFSHNPLLTPQDDS